VPFVSCLSRLEGAGWRRPSPADAPSDGVAALLAGADADGFLDRGDEDLAVADASGAGRLHDRLDRAVEEGVVQDHLDLDLGQKVDDVFGSAVKLGMALLPSEALGLQNRNPLQSHLVESLFDLVELEGL